MALYLESFLNGLMLEI